MLLKRSSSPQDFPNDTEASKRDKETVTRCQARDLSKLQQEQEDYLRTEIRKFRRYKLKHYHTMEQDLLKDELDKRQMQFNQAHEMLMRHHEMTKDLEYRQQRCIHQLRDDHLRKQHQTELTNQQEYNSRRETDLRKKHALELKQQPKSLKQKEYEIRKQFRDTCKIQTKQYKQYKSQMLLCTPREEQKNVMKKLKEEQVRKLALLGEQYEQSIAEMLQKQSVSIE